MDIRPASIHVAPGTQGTYAGFPAAVTGHYDGNMYDIRVPGGVCCVDVSDFIPTAPTEQFTAEVAAYKALCAAAR